MSIIPTAPPARRTYTLREANAALPEVRRLLAELRRAVAGLDELKARMLGATPRESGAAPTDDAARASMDDGDEGSGHGHHHDDIPKPEPDTWVDPGHFLLIGLFHHSVSRFNEMGIEVRDVTKGLIDFPFRAPGEDLLLCWQDGEDQVAFFHDRSSGFEGRKPVDELPDAGLLPQPPEEEGGEEG